MFTLFACTLVICSLFHSIEGEFEIVHFENCEDSDDSICEIKEVRVEPCKEAKSRKPCKFKSGSNSTIEFDYVPHFDAEALVGQVYSASLLDLPLLGMDRDGCKFTECPAKSGQLATYRNQLHISRLFPLSNYNVKWRLWNAGEDTKGCCLSFRIRLVR